jgi:hypothetical protein
MCVYRYIRFRVGWRDHSRIQAQRHSATGGQSVTAHVAVGEAALHRFSERRTSGLDWWRRRHRDWVDDSVEFDIDNFHTASASVCVVLRDQERHETGHRSPVKHRPYATGTSLTPARVCGWVGSPGSPSVRPKPQPRHAPFSRGAGTRRRSPAAVSASSCNPFLSNWLPVKFVPLFRQ